MTEIIQQYLPSVIMVVIGLFLTNQDKKRAKKTEDHQNHLSAMFSRMTTCIIASNEGTLALARCVKNGDLNGGLTAAMEKIAKANEGFTNFVQELAANNLSKR